jgi:predicted amidophosphoribosyltransferase
MVKFNWMILNGQVIRGECPHCKRYVEIFKYTYCPHCGTKLN